MVVLWRNVFCCCCEEPVGESITRGRPNAPKSAPIAVEAQPNLQDKSVDPPNVITLNGTPKIKFWVDRIKFQYSDYRVFEGCFGNSPVSVKQCPRTPKETEANILMNLDHENIIQLLCKIDDEKYVYIVTEDIQISLKNYVQENDQVDFGAPFLTTREIMQQLASVVSYLCDSEIILLNLNSQNVRVVARNKTAKIKLMGFENSVKIKGSEKVLIKSLQGVDGFVAPEVKVDKFACFSSDVFSLGCVYYFIFTKGGELPKVETAEEESKVVEKLHMLQAKQPSNEVILCVSMMRKMMKFDCNARPTISAVKNHPFFWDTTKVSDLILETCKKLENDENKEFRQKLENKKTKVIGQDWTGKINQEIIAELNEKRHYDGSFLSHLVRGIRNQIVHKPLPVAENLIGKTNEEILDYWLEKFPYLVCHLCKVLELD